MKKHIGFSAVFLLSFILGQIQVTAQNVGIGTITPTSKLTIAGNEGTNNGQNASLKIENLNSDNAWFIRAGAIGTTTPNGGLSIGDNAAYRLAITSNGLVGIGLLEPFETLHLNGSIRQDFSLKGIIQNGLDAAMITRGFDPFSSGKHIGLGRWGLFMEPSTLTLGIPDVTGKRMAVSTFNTNSLVAKELLVVSQNGNVGIGTSNPAWKLDVNGGMQLQGRLVVGGSSGTTGQVLTSNGSEVPGWQTLNAAFDNNIRFSFVVSNPTNTSGTLNITNRYNTNPAAVSLSGSIITFNTTGIYHFEMSILGRIDYASALNYNPLFNINMILVGGVGNGNNPVAEARLERGGLGTNSYFGSAITGTDMYITAGQTMVLSFGYSGTSTGIGTITEIDTFGYLRGYLISN